MEVVWTVFNGKLAISVTVPATAGQCWSPSRSGIDLLLGPLVGEGDDSDDDFVASSTASSAISLSDTRDELLVTNAEVCFHNYIYPMSSISGRLKLRWMLTWTSWTACGPTWTIFHEKADVERLLVVPCRDKTH